MHAGVLVDSGRGQAAGSRGCTAEDRVLTRHGLDGGGNISLRAKSESEEPGSATSQVEHVSPGARKRQGSNTAGAPRLLAGSANGCGEVGKVMALARAKVPTGANLALLVPKFLPFFSFILPQVDCLESTACVYERSAPLPPSPGWEVLTSVKIFRKARWTQPAPSKGRQCGTAVMNMEVESIGLALLCIISNVGFGESIYLSKLRLIQK